MMNTVTLTSLAMLKVNSDVQNQDYIEYLRPFVLAVLSKNTPDQVTDASVAELIRSDFGLNIPNRAVQLVLQRLVKKGILKKNIGIFQTISEIPPSGIEIRRADAQRHMQTVVTSLVDYSKTTSFVFTGEQDATDALLSFLAEFSIECLRTYIFGTALPDIPERNNKSIVLISRFIRDISQNNLPLLESFMVLVKGHMLANALICPDLDSQRLAFKKVKFYLDTPLVIRLLGLEGKERELAAIEMINLVSNLGGACLVFEHTCQEIYNVIRAAAEYVDRPEGRSTIVIESRRSGKKRSDLLLSAERLDSTLSSFSIFRAKTPPYTIRLQIDETAFESMLNEDINYSNEKAKLFDTQILI